MPSRIFDSHGNSFILSEDNINGARPTYGVRTRSTVAPSNFTCGVLSVPTDPSPMCDIPTQSPQGDIFSVKL